MKKLITILLIINFQFLISNCDAQPIWVVSGAPIGDTSAYLYPVGGWVAGTSLTLQHALGQDSLKVFNTTGNAVGIHIYRVDKIPNAICGSPNIGNNNRYFGVFVINGTTPTYEVSYYYAGNPFITPAVEPDLELAERPTNADTTCAAWSAMGATLDVVGDSLYKSGLSGRKEIILTTKTIPLPIELLSFTGKDKGSSNLLEWTTATEINNDFFTLESSKNALNWRVINTTVGAGNSNNLINYQYADYNYYTPLTYYRLKQTDFDGSSTYSQIVAVHKNNNGNSTIAIYPNPTNNIIYLDFFGNRTEYNTIRITNSLGQVVREINVTNSKLKIDLTTYVKGIYFIQVTNKNQTLAIEKIIKN